MEKRAENRWFANQGWEVVNMTQYPECILARELGMCYVNISLITDYDVGQEGNPDIFPVTSAQVMEVFGNNNHKLRALLHELITSLPGERNCGCYRHLLDALPFDFRGRLFTKD